MAQKPKSDFDSSDRKLTTAFLASPVVWFTHLSVSYILVPQACVSETKLPLHLLTIVAMAVTIVSCVYSLRWLRTYGTGATDGGTHEMRMRFMAIAGTAFGAVFTLLILATGIPNLMFHACS